MSKAVNNQKPRTTVLNIGIEPVYLQRRRQILEGAGFQVLDAAPFEYALELARSHDARVAIFGHLVASNDRVRISEALKRDNPAIRLVVLYDRSVDKTESADAVLHINLPPIDLVQSIEYLLSGGASPSLAAASG